MCCLCNPPQAEQDSVLHMQEPKKMEENIMRFTLDYDQYAALARQTAAEGCVLLKNEKEALPIRKRRDSFRVWTDCLYLL